MCTSWGGSSLVAACECALRWLCWRLALGTAPGKTPDAPSQPTLTRKSQPNEAAAGSCKITYTLPKGQVPEGDSRCQASRRCSASTAGASSRQLALAARPLHMTACHVACPAKATLCCCQVCSPAPFRQRRPVMQLSPTMTCHVPCSITKAHSAAAPSLTRCLSGTLDRDGLSCCQCHDTPARVHGEPNHQQQHR